MFTMRVEFQVPSGILASLHCAPEEFGDELRLAAGVKWYEMGKVSQGRAAEIAGVSRAEFVAALSRFGVSPFQTDVDELIDEVLPGAVDQRHSSCPVCLGLVCPSLKR